MKFTTKVISFAQGEQIGVYRGDELICVANWINGKANNIEFTEPSYQKSNPTRQAAMKALQKAEDK